uniref:hypothetical protein n=1 Tax=Pseudomonas laurentiana TaxID=2364649 RepID=UPI0029C71CE3|nr:hypothetical protein [Pseudomonas laurentiana]
MSQFDFGTIDPNSKSGPQLALDLNKFRDALNTLHRGTVRPAYAQGGMLWVRETSSTQWDLMFFDGDTDFVFRSVNPTANTLIGIPQSQIEGLSTTFSDLDGKYVGKDSATGAATLPSGTTAQRPASPVAGMLRYNTSTSKMERYIGGKWLTHGDMDGPLNEASVSSLDSASASIAYLYNNTISITGTTTITTLGASGTSGMVRRLVFTTALQLTHNAASFILPGGSNITTAVGDVAEFVCLGSGNWRCLYYSRASGAPIAMPVTYTPEYALTPGAIYPVTHSYGANASVEFIYVCNTADIGYSVGDELEPKDFKYNPDTGARTMGAYLASRSSSGFAIGIGYGAIWVFPTKATGVAANITLARWTVKARIKP